MNSLVQYAPTTDSIRFSFSSECNIGRVIIKNRHTIENFLGNQIYEFAAKDLAHGNSYDFEICAESFPNNNTLLIECTTLKKHHLTADFKTLDYDKQKALNYEKDIYRKLKENDFKKNLGKSKKINVLLYGEKGVGKHTWLSNISSIFLNDEDDSFITCKKTTEIRLINFSNRVWFHLCSSEQDIKDKKMELHKAIILFDGNRLDDYEYVNRNTSILKELEKNGVEYSVILTKVDLFTERNKLINVKELFEANEIFRERSGVIENAAAELKIENMKVYPSISRTSISVTDVDWKIVTLIPLKNLLLD